MSDFQTSAELSLEVSTQELRNVRRDIENALSDISLGIEADPRLGGGGRAGSGGDSDPREQRRRRREFRWARQRTGDMEDAVELLDDIKRNTAEQGGDSLLGGLAGGLGDLGGILPQALATGIGSAVGTAVGGAVDDATVTVEDTDPLAIESIDPLAVDDPSPLSVEDTVLSVDAPLLEVEELAPLLVDDPSPLQVEDIPPVQVERPEWKIGVEQPDPIEVNIVGGPGGGGGGAGDSAPRGRTIGEITRGLVERLPGGDTISDLDRRGTEAVREQFDRVPGIGGREPVRFGNQPSEVDRRGNQTNRNTGSGGGSGDVTTVQVQQDNTVNVDVQNNIDMDRFVDETVDAFEREIEQVRRDIERDIDRLEREIARATS